MKNTKVVVTLVCDICQDSSDSDEDRTEEEALHSLIDAGWERTGTITSPIWVCPKCIEIYNRIAALKK